MAFAETAGDETAKLSSHWYPGGGVEYESVGMACQIHVDQAQVGINHG